MFENNCDDDFDFDLDEVVKINTQPRNVTITSSQADANKVCKSLNENTGILTSQKCQENILLPPSSQCANTDARVSNYTPKQISNPSSQIFNNGLNISAEKSKGNSFANALPSQNCQKGVRISNEKPREISNQTLCAGEDWGSDDDSHFLDIVDPGPEEYISTPKQPINTSQMIGDKSVLESSSHNLGKTTGAHHNINNSSLNLNNKTAQSKASEKVAAKFPGPAGLLNLDSKTNNQLKGQRPKITRNLTNMDGLCWWDKALSLLDVKSSWGNMKMNLQMIRKAFAPGVVYITAPLLVVGVQKIECTPVITNDIDCDLQDPTGEEKGRILKDLFADYGKFLQVGTVLVLRRPSVLSVSSKCVVTITKTCLIGIYSAHTNEIIRCRDFAKEDLISWFSEPMVYGDPILVEEASEAEPKNTGVTLFTSAGQPRANSSLNSRPAGMQSPASRFNGSPASGYNYNNNNNPRAPLNHTPRPPMARPPGQSTPRLPPVRPSVPINVHNSPVVATPPVRPAANNSQFQFKAPSTVLSNTRPVPYAPPSRSPSAFNVTAHSTSTSSTSKSTMSNATSARQEVDEQFLSQFLEGIDTDALFDDF